MRLRTSARYTTARTNTDASFRKWQHGRTATHLRSRCPAARRAWEKERDLREKGRMETCKVSNFRSGCLRSFRRIQDEKRTPMCETSSSSCNRRLRGNQSGNATSATSPTTSTRRIAGTDFGDSGFCRNLACGDSGAYGESRFSSNGACGSDARGASGFCRSGA